MAGSIHIDERCEIKIIELANELRECKRESGEGSLLILVPESPEEPIVMAIDGNLLPKELIEKLPDSAVIENLRVRLYRRQEESSSQAQEKQEI